MLLQLDDSRSQTQRCSVGHMTAIELYAGAGGMSLGLARAGFSILKAYDFNTSAVEVYNRNIGYHAELADLSKVAEMAGRMALLRPDLIAGGPPCQDFSSAGHREEGERANHTRVFAMYVCCACPEWFLMENVARARHSEAWRDAVGMLRNAGYGITQLVLDASRYGVPQRRKRLVAIGRRGERDGFLDASILQAASPRPMSLRDVFGDQIGDHFYSHPRSARRRGVWSVDGPGPTIRNARRPQPQTYVPHPNDSNFLEAGKAYVLSQADMSRIQGFPVSWDWTGQLVGDVDQMIANAVPPPLAAALGTVIANRHSGNSVPEVPGNFGQWLSQRRGMSSQVVANLKWRVRRARQLVGARDFRCQGTEAHFLEKAMEMEGLNPARRSDLRRALRTFREWQEQEAAEGKRSGMRAKR